MTRYRPEGGKIVGEGLAERYYSNRAVYEGHISAYFMAGDRPHLRYCRNRWMLGTLRMFRDGRPLDELGPDEVRMEYSPNIVRWIVGGDRPFTITATTPGEGLGFVVRVEPETELTFVFRGIANKKPDTSGSASDAWCFTPFSVDASLLTTEFDPAWLEGNRSGTENGVCYIENRAAGEWFRDGGRVYLVSDGPSSEKDGVIDGSFRQILAVSPDLPADPAALFEAGIERGRDLWRALEVETPDEVINAAVHAAVAEINGCWHPPKSVHGNMCWNEPLVGWMLHGQHIPGWHDRAKATLKAYAKAQIREDEKRGYERNDAGTLPAENSRFYGQGYIAEDQMFYNMQTQFFHQMISAWRYSGDEETGAILRDMLRLHLKREDECFDPDGTGLYESVINTWPTDSVYTPGGAVEETCYVYDQYKALAELTEGGEKAACEAKAEKIRKAFFEKLWIPGRGYPGEFVEYAGQGRLHTDSWIYAAFLPIECGLVSGLDAYQCADYPRWALKRDEKGLYWISNWTPGIWSVRECSAGENMQLAIAGFKAGKPDESAAVVSGLAKRALDSIVPGELTFPTSEAATQLARAVVEGLFGYRPDYPNGAAAFEPAIPASWEKAGIRTRDFELSYTRTGMKVRLARPARLTLRMRLYAEELDGVEGAESWRLIPAVGGMIVEADMGTTDNAELKLKLKGFRDFDKPEELTALPADMDGIHDPQNAAAEPWGHHLMFRKTPGGWYAPIRLDLGKDPAKTELLRRQRQPVPENAEFEPVDLGAVFNADVRRIFEQNYRTPRPERGCHAEIGYDGYSLWTFPFWSIRPLEMKIECGGLLDTGAGVPIRIEAGERNVVFTSLWDNFPDRVTIPVGLSGRMIFAAVAGSTNPNLCGIENARLIFRYAGGEEEVLPLVNPQNYIQLSPYTERAPSKGYESRRDVFNPYDEALLEDFTPEILPLGENLRALVLRWPLREGAVLESVTLETTCPDVVAGVMGITVAK